MLDVILDAAGQKGTGKWTVISAMELGQPVLLVAEAVGARMLSSFVELRRQAEGAFANSATEAAIELPESTIAAAVYAAKIISYAQGFMLLDEASEALGWNLDLGTVARLWRAGCIIRAAFLDDIAEAYAGAHPDNLLLAPFFTDAIHDAVPALRSCVIAAAQAGIPTPAFSSALAFFDGLRRSRGSANLIQAQRDFFGAHTYERVDRPRGEFFHTDWAGSGGQATSGSYSA